MDCMSANLRILEQFGWHNFTSAPALLEVEDRDFIRKLQFTLGLLTMLHTTRWKPRCHQTSLLQAVQCLGTHDSS